MNWSSIKILFAAFIVCFPLVAVGQYRFDIWTTDNGLPQSTVDGLLQSSDGYLWFTTNDGIVRFDGVRFKVFNKANTKGLIHNRYGKSFEDKSGRLWFRPDGSDLVLYENNTFTTFTKENGLPSSFRSLLFDNGTGSIMFSSDDGYYQYQDGKFVRFELKGAKNGNRICSIDREGGIWLNGESGLQRIKDNQITNYNIKHGECGGARTVYEDRLGNFWISDGYQKLRRIYKGQIQTYDDMPVALYNFVEDKKGNLWMTHHTGLYRVDAETVAADKPQSKGIQKFTAKEGLSDNNVISMCVDREGSVWIGTVAGGLNQITPQAVHVFSKQDWNTDFNTVYPIFEDIYNNVWLGVWTANLVKYSPEGRFTVYNNNPATVLISSLFEDSNKRLWIGTLGNVFLYENGNFINMNEALGFQRIGDVCAITQDKQGNMWFGSSQGLIRFANSTAKLFTTQDGLPGNKITAISQSVNGKMWIGTRSGLALYENEKFTSFNEEKGLSSNYVRSLYEDSDGVLWIGSYDGGLSRYKDGKFSNFTMKEGLYSNNVFCILEDDNGWFWINSNRGIYRVLRQQLNDFADGRVSFLTSIAYTTRDGLLNAEGNGERQPAGIRRRNGELWFPTLNGAAVINPKEIVINSTPPPVRLEEIFIDRKEIENYKDTIQLAAGQENLEIHYTGLSFTDSAQNKFRYHLEGFEDNWNEVGTRRAAYYSYLPPGTYTFRVLGANRDGFWNMEGTSIKIIVHPHFYQTWWFRILAVLSITGLVFLGYSYRVSQLKKINAARTAFAQQLIESQEAERKRIAAELHDGLGQSLVIIKNRVGFVIDNNDDKERTLHELDEISDTASHALDEVREITYNLRPYQLERLGLTKAVKSMLRRASGVVNFNSEIDSIDNAFSKDSEMNVYRIIQECVNNIIKHSEASEVKIQIKCDEQTVAITIEDNGKGFDVDKIRANRGGFGLLGLTERTNLLGGEFNVISNTGTGTTVKIRLPIKNQLKYG